MARNIIRSALIVLAAACRERGEGATLAVCEAGQEPAAIQAAVDAAAVGDTIDIAGGMFAENLVLDLDKRLTLRGAGSADTIIDATGGADATFSPAGGRNGITLTAAGISSTRSLNITGLTVANAGADGIYAYKSGGLNLDNVVLNDVVLKDNAKRGIYIHDDVVVSDMHIVNCKFISNGAQGLRTASTVVVNSMTLENSMFRQNWGGIHLQGMINGVTIHGTKFADRSVNN